MPDNRDNFSGSPATARTFTSFSGSDIDVIFYVPPEYAFGMDLLSPADVFRGSSPYDGVISEGGGFLLVGNLHTLTVSSTRTIGPVRRLGESRVATYCLGGRTVAGTMIFSMLYRSAFQEIYRRFRGENLYEPFYVDMLPPFSVFIRGGTEHGHKGRAALDGVRLVNFGTTFSVDDMVVEESYNFVATDYVPFVPDEDAQGLREKMGQWLKIQQGEHPYIESPGRRVSDLRAG